MRHFIGNKEYAKNTLVVFVIFLFLMGGLYVFEVDKNFIYNFKPYYLQARWDAYRLKNIEANSIGNKEGDYADAVPVLIYHSVLSDLDQDNIEAGEGVNVTLNIFRDQMMALKSAGWQTVSMSDFRDFIKYGKRIPKKSFLLTFDDGRKDSYYPVDPILKSLGYNAVMFIITEKSLTKDGKPSSFYLSSDETEEMLQSGRWEIHSHGAFDHDTYAIDANGINKGHFLGNKLWQEKDSRIETDDEFSRRIAQDLVSSKDAVSYFTKTDAFAFAYPFNDYGNQSQNYQEAESVVLPTVHSVYQLAFYQVDAKDGIGFNYPSQDAFMMKRLKFNSNTSGTELVEYFSRSVSKELPYGDNFVSDNGWYGNWGDVKISDETLSVGANEKTTGGMVLLDGSQLWGNINFSAKIKNVHGEAISVVSRYADNKNYLACTYTGMYVRLEQVVNGQKTVLNEVRFKAPTDAISDIGMKVIDERAECFINGKIITNGKIDASIQSGMIGFKTWDEQPGNSRLIIESVNINNEN